MDILLGDDANGFDLLIDAASDVQLALTHEHKLLNSIKVALFTQENWQASDLLSAAPKARIDQLAMSVINEQNRAYLERELQAALAFLIDEKIVNSVVVNVKIRNNRNYLFHLDIDGKVMDITALLEVRE